MATPQRFSQIPLEVSSASMMAHAKPGDLIVLLILQNVGNTGTFRLQGRTNRTIRFDYNRRELRHELRVPAKIWRLDKLALAREVTDHTLHTPIIFDVEVIAGEVKPDESPETKKEDPKKEVDPTLPVKGNVLDAVTQAAIFAAVKDMAPIRLKDLRKHLEANAKLSLTNDEILEVLIPPVYAPIHAGWVRLATVAQEPQKPADADESATETPETEEQPLDNEPRNRSITRSQLPNPRPEANLSH